MSGTVAGRRVISQENSSSIFHKKIEAGRSARPPLSGSQGGIRTPDPMVNPAPGGTLPAGYPADIVLYPAPLSSSPTALPHCVFLTPCSISASSHLQSCASTLHQTVQHHYVHEAVCSDRRSVRSSASRCYCSSICMSNIP